MIISKIPLRTSIVLLGVDAVPPGVTRSPVLVACLVATGLVSVTLTHEYLSWNGARDRAVRSLVARGVPAAEIDGGFEQNGPLHFEAFLKRTGQVIVPGRFWLDGAPYRLSFWPSRTADCTTEERYPYWTWPGGGDPAMYVLHCAGPPPTAE